MRRRLLRSVIFSSVAVLICGTAWAQANRPPDAPGDNPPVRQVIGTLDTESQFLAEADCRGCHASGVPDRHHLLYGLPIPAGTLVPFPDSDGDGNPDTIYTCLSCHDQNFTVVRDCLACHNTGSPHHTGPDASSRNCVACHGDLVDNYDDGHYIPTYSPSLVTPWRGLNGDGYENATYPTPDTVSDGSGAVIPTDVTITEGGPPFFSVTAIGPLGTAHIRNEPAQLKFKPAGDHNDFFIGSTHHGGEEYTVVFNAGSPLAAIWDAGTQTLTVTLDTTQTALAVVTAINTATGSVDVEATLGYDGGAVGDPGVTLLADEHYEPLGDIGNPNNRGFGAGSCSYCHDFDGATDANGDHAPVLILNNHDTHHGVMNNTWGGFPARCNICHDYSNLVQSGPQFDVAIRICEECHGPDSLHNIQADSDGDGNVIVGGELAGYGHVGRDGGPGDSDCWGCHGFGTSSANIPFAGPVIPTIHSADKAVVSAGRTTPVILQGSGFTNTAGSEQFDSEVVLTAADGSKVNLTPVMLLEDMVAVVLPADLAAGNYNLQAVKVDTASNPTVVSVVPKVSISEATGDQTVTITGLGFGGYAEGSGTSVTAGGTEATIISWSDTSIVAEFSSAPSEVTVNSVFGSATAEVVSGGGGDAWKLQGPNGDATVRFEAAGNYLSVTTTYPDGSSSVTFGIEMSGSVYWVDSSGAVYFGNIDRVRGTMSGVVFGGSGGTFFAEQL